MCDFHHHQTSASKDTGVCSSGGVVSSRAERHTAHTLCWQGAFPILLFTKSDRPPHAHDCMWNLCLPVTILSHRRCKRREVAASAAGKSKSAEWFCVSVTSDKHERRKASEERGSFKKVFRQLDEPSVHMDQFGFILLPVKTGINSWRLPISSKSDIKHELLSPHSCTESQC